MLGISIDKREVQSENALSSILVTPSGILIFFSDEQLANADLPNSDKLVGIFTDTREVQPSNACSSIAETELGIVNVARDEQP